MLLKQDSTSNLNIQEIPYNTGHLATLFKLGKKLIFNNYNNHDNYEFFIQRILS